MPLRLKSSQDPCCFLTLALNSPMTISFSWFSRPEYSVSWWHFKAIILFRQEWFWERPILMFRCCNSLAAKAVLDSVFTIQKGSYSWNEVFVLRISLFCSCIKWIAIIHIKITSLVCTGMFDAPFLAPSQESGWAVLFLNRGCSVSFHEGHDDNIKINLLLLIYWFMTIYFQPVKSAHDATPSLLCDF